MIVMEARQQGNALFLTIPAKFNVEANTEFLAFIGEPGSITYVPKQENVFAATAVNEESLRTPLDENYLFDIEV